MQKCFSSAHVEESATKDQKYSDKGISLVKMFYCSKILFSLLKFLTLFIFLRRVSSSFSIFDDSLTYVFASFSWAIDGGSRTSGSANFHSSNYQNKLTTNIHQVKENFCCSGLPRPVFLVFSMCFFSFDTKITYYTKPSTYFYLVI